MKQPPFRNRLRSGELKSMMTSLGKNAMISKQNLSLKYIPLMVAARKVLQN